MVNLSEDSITAVFEKLVAEGVVMYGPHEVVREDAGGFPVRRRRRGCARQY
jgi:ATP adenylyltransferase